LPVISPANAAVAFAPVRTAATHRFPPPVCAATAVGAEPNFRGCVFVRSTDTPGEDQSDVLRAIGASV
jgi:hypothetical protein